MEKYWRKDSGGEVGGQWEPAISVADWHLPKLSSYSYTESGWFLDDYISKGWFPGPRERKSLLGCKIG